MDRDVIITSGGKTVPLNDFVRRLTAGAVLGLVGSFECVDTNQEIVVRICAQESGTRGNA